jgi:hypothetical protein
MAFNFNGAVKVGEELLGRDLDRETVEAANMIEKKLSLSGKGLRNTMMDIDKSGTVIEKHGNFKVKGMTAEDKAERILEQQGKIEANEYRTSGQRFDDILNRRKAFEQSVQDEYSGYNQRVNESAQSRRTSSSKTIDKQLNQKEYKGGKPKTIEQFVDQRISKQTSAINSEAEELRGLLGQGKLTNDQAVKITGDKNMTASALTGAHIDAYEANQLAGIKKNATLGDKMIYNQVPQKVAAVGGAAWIVSAMAESKGQMSNSQLYGQSAPYGGGGY